MSRTIAPCRPHFEPENPRLVDTAVGARPVSASNGVRRPSLLERWQRSQVREGEQEEMGESRAPVGAVERAVVGILRMKDILASRTVDLRHHHDEVAAQSDSFPRLGREAVSVSHQPPTP